MLRAEPNEGGLVNWSLARRTGATLAALGVLAMVLTLAACGRKGPLDLPPSAANEQPVAADTTAGVAAHNNSNGMGPDGHPVAPPGAKRPLPMDWLLN